jgi:RNA polymerase sigma-70 factor (ECF subfamily)
MATTNGDGSGEFGDAPLVHARALASHHGFVKALARGLVGRPDFEDVAQEALLAGLKRPPARAESLTSWLATTVRHLASKLHRGDARRARREEAAARPEALPSAHELVERIELEQVVVRAVLTLKEPQRTAVLLRFYEGHATAAIAERLGVPADTVRARLRRGLAELRVQLDTKFGREEWVAALLPVAGIPPGILGPALAKSTVAAGMTGAAVMGAKAITIVASACATAVLAWWVLPDHFVASLFGPAPLTSAAKGGDNGGPTAGAKPLAAPAAVNGGGLAATREAETSEAAAAAAQKNLPPPGSVHIEVVDAHTRKPLDHVKIHFLHEQRFADYDSDATVNVKLTSGKWDANVASVGFEPAQLTGFEVKAGETVNLGVVGLERGNSVVEGRVVANHLAADKPVVVELFGDGRAPCDACLAKQLHAAAEEGQDLKIGADCGFRDDRDLLNVTGNRAFKFTNLAAGVYWLRACDPDQRIVSAVRLDVGRGGTIWQELNVCAPTLARFELRHDSGGLFSGAWSNIHKANVASIHYSFRMGRSGGQEVGTIDHTPSAEETLASVGPPLPIPGRDTGLADAPNAGQTLQLRWFVTAVGTGSKNGISLFSRLSDTGLQERLDRERQEGDRLGFDFGTPLCDNVALALKAVRPDLHEIAPLPRAELSVVVSCGDYTSDELPLDLQGDQFQPLVVTMHVKKEIADRQAEIRKGPPASCVACHGSEAPTDGNTVYGSPQATVQFLSDTPILNFGGDGKSDMTVDFGSILQDALNTVQPAKADPAPDKGDH